MTQKQIRAAVAELRPRLKKWDITRANILCDELHGLSYTEPATLTRWLNGQMTSPFAYELYTCLLQVVEEREKREKEKEARQTAYRAKRQGTIQNVAPNQAFAEGATATV